MESNLLEVLIFSKGNPKKKAIAEQMAKRLLPVIRNLEHDARKLILKTLKDTPAIYLS